MVIGAGPYIGDFYHEVLNFRPYCKWLYTALDSEDFFVYTHHNRRFLYNWLPDDRIFHIRSHLTKNDEKQNGNIHGDVNGKMFCSIAKDFKTLICEKFNVKKRQIKIFHLGYSKNSFLTFYKKIYEPIQVEYKPKSLGTVFIPDFENNDSKANRIYNDIINIINPTVISCNNGGFRDSVELDYESMVSIISSADLVICPAGFWTFLANLQRVPVFSWGTQISSYKEGGTYYFNNNASHVIYHDKDSKLDFIRSGLEYVSGLIKR